MCLEIQPLTLVGLDVVVDRNMIKGVDTLVCIASGNVKVHTKHTFNNKLAWNSFKTVFVITNNLTVDIRQWLTFQGFLSLK